MRRLALILASASLLSTAACNKGSAAPPPTDAPPAAATGMEKSITGRVQEKLDSAGYSYLRLAGPSGEIWAAVPQASAKIGDTVTVNVQMPMDGYESPTLHRKFDHLVFATLAGSGAPASAAPSAPSAPAAVGGAFGAGMRSDQPANAPAPSAAAAPADKIEKPRGGEAIAELRKNKDALKDKKVILRGKVVKFTANVMGKNWLHLQDGSGAAESDGDVAVTTADAAKVGDVVQVEGTLHTGRDFGAGYAYDVIVEDAKIVR